MANGNKLSQRINVDLDLGQARLQFRWLKALMESITGPYGFSHNLQQGITSEIMESTKYATLLRTQLALATNPLTGNLNLTKFNDLLRLSGTNLLDYQKQLSALGSAGNLAFNSLASSIASAETPLLRTSAAALQMWTALGNTVRWQATSSLVHGVMSTAASAMNYVKNLDSSLNDIRIVTGQTLDQMAKFAVLANLAAKALNTTTNLYAQAALIYYQLGLSNKLVEERTEATIKLANVSGQSAKKVSDLMTAVWNNFYDGGKSLEYYADVITALGATTASSSEEIARGLSKFSSIALTTGLSYEYATSALSTIVAATRQSADSVGTSLKTLFSRFLGLSLGETLDDGTALNKYSKALNTVGVSVLTANGQLRDMDNILADLGDRWLTLSKALQAALALTIGGTRGYTTLMSLMDNWDSFEKNLLTAQNAQGTLDALAAIYAESWEAASKHVRAASETIYKNLLSDNFFKGATNLFGTLLDGVGSFTTGLGGVSGTLLLLGGIASRVFKDLIATGIDNAALNLRGIFYGEQDIVNIKQLASEALRAPVTFSKYDEVNKLQENYNRALDRRQILYDLLLLSNKIPSYLKPVYLSMFNASDMLAQLVVKAAEQYYSAVEENDFLRMIERLTLARNNNEYINQLHDTMIKNIMQASKDGRIGAEWSTKDKAELYYNNYVNNLNTSGNANTAAAISKAESAIPGIRDVYNYEQKFGFNGTKNSGINRIYDQLLEFYERHYQNLRIASELGSLSGKTGPSAGLSYTDLQINRTASKIVELSTGFKSLNFNLDGTLSPLKTTSDEIERLTNSLKNGDISKEVYQTLIRDLITKLLGEGQNGERTIGDLIAKYTDENFKATASIQKNMVNTILKSLGLTRDSATPEELKAALDTVNSDLARLKSLTGGKLDLASLTGRLDKSAADIFKSLTDPNLLKNTVSLGTGLTTLSGAAASVGSSIISFTNTLKVFGDETATSGQKASALVSSLGTLPMAFTNTNKLINSFGDHLKIFGTETAMTMGGLTAITAGIAATALVVGTIVKALQLGTEETALKNFTAATATATQKTAEAALKSELLSVLEDSHNQLLLNLNNTLAGTLENTKALMQANQAANLIIDLYDLKYGTHYTYGLNGEIVFDATKMQEVQEQANNAALLAMYNESYIRSTQSLLLARDQEKNEELNSDLKQLFNQEFSYEVQRGKRTDIDTSTFKDELDQYTRYISGLQDSSIALSFTEYAGSQVVEAIGSVLGKSSVEVEELVQKSLDGLWPGQETITDNALLNKLFSAEESSNRLLQLATSLELLETAGQLLKATGLLTDLAVAYLSSDKDALINREAILATIASRAAEDTWFEKIFSNTSTGMASAKLYYEKLGLGSAQGLSQDEIKEGILAKIMQETNINGAEGLKALVGNDLWNSTFKDLLGEDFEGIKDVIATTEHLGISNLNNFKNLKVSDVNKELDNLQDKIKKYEHHLEVAGPALSELGRELMTKELELMKSYEEAVLLLTSSMITNTIETLGQNLSQSILGTGNAIDTFNALNAKGYSLNEMQSIAGYIAQGNVFYGLNTADAIYNAFVNDNLSSKAAFEAMNRIDWSTSLSSLADLSKYANRAGESMEIFSDVFNSAVKDIGGEGGLFQSLYKSSGFSKVLEKLEGIYQTNGRITSLDIQKYAEKSEELYDFLLIGRNSELVNVNAGGLAATLNAILSGDITAPEVTSGLVSALSVANQRAEIEAEAFDIVDNLELGRSGADLIKFSRELGKAFYTAKTNRLTMDDPLMAVMDLMPDFYRDKYYEGLKNGALKSFDDIMKDPDLAPMVSFLTKMGGTGKYAGKGGGYMTDVINFFDQELKNYSIRDENGELKNAFDYLVNEKGIGFGTNNINLLDESTGLTTTELLNSLQTAFMSMMSEEAANQWATIFTEYVSNTSAGMYLAANDTAEAIDILYNAANKGQYINPTIDENGNQILDENGNPINEYAGLHYYTEDELKAFYNSRKDFLNPEIYGNNLNEFIQYMTSGENRNALLLAKVTEPFKNGTMDLGPDTLEAIRAANEDLNKEYGIANDLTFKDITSLLYSYGAITEKNGLQYLDTQRFTDFIVASGGSEAAASAILKGVGNFEDVYGATLGTTITDKLGNQYSVVLKDGETYDLYAARVAGYQKGFADEKFWVEDTESEIEINGTKVKTGGHYVEDEGGYVRRELQKQGWQVGEDGTWHPPSGDTGLINGNLGTNSTTASSGTTSPPSSGGGTSGTGGTTTGAGTTTTTTSPPRSPSSNYISEGLFGKLVNNLGGWDKAVAATMAAGFAATPNGITDYAKYIGNSLVPENWVITDDLITYADKITGKSNVTSSDKAQRDGQKRTLMTLGYSESEANAIVNGRITKEAVDNAKQRQENGDLFAPISSKKQAELIDRNIINDSLAAQHFKDTLKAEADAKKMSGLIEYYGSLSEAYKAYEAYKEYWRDPEGKFATWDNFVHSTLIKLMEEQLKAEAEAEAAMVERYGNWDAAYGKKKSGETWAEFAKRTEIMDADIAKWNLIAQEKIAADKASKLAGENAASEVRENETNFSQKIIDEFGLSQEDIAESYLSPEDLYNQLTKSRKAEEAKTITSDEALAKAQLAIVEGADAEVIDYYLNLAKLKSVEEKKAAEEKFAAELKAAEEALKAEQETYIAQNQEAYERYQGLVTELNGEASFAEFQKWNETNNVLANIDTENNLNKIQELEVRNAEIESLLGNTADADAAQRLVEELNANKETIDKLTYLNDAIAYNLTMSADERISAVLAAVDKANAGGELSSFERTLISMLSDIGEDVGLQTDIAKEAGEEAEKTGAKKATKYDAETGKMYDEEGNEIEMPYESPTLTGTPDYSPSSSSDTSTPSGTPSTDTTGTPSGTPSTDTTSGASDLFTKIGHGYSEDHGKYDIYTGPDGNKYGYNPETQETFGLDDAAKQLIANNTALTNMGAATGLFIGQNNARILQFAQGHMAVTGELGPELTIREDGTVDMLGLHGREYTWVNPNDIIYTAAQTASILGNNNIEWLEGFAKGFNNKINGYGNGTGEYTPGTSTATYSSSDVVANTDNPGGVNGFSGVGEAVRRGAYSGTYGGAMAAAEEEVKDPRYDPNTLKERDIVTRYFTILQQIDDITREVEYFGKVAERAWGEERVQAIQRQTDAYKEQYAAYQKYMAEIETYLRSDLDALTLMVEEFARDFKEKTSIDIFGGESSSGSKGAMKTTNVVYGAGWASGYNNNIKPHSAGILVDQAKAKMYSEIGSGTSTDGTGDPNLRTPINWVSAEYDANGVLTNYREIVTRLMEVYNENAEAFAQDKEAQYKFQEMLKDIQFYTDSLNLYEQLKEVFSDLRNAILDNQIRKIVYEISYENELDNNALKEINYNFEKIRDNAYRSAEAIDYYATKMDYLDKSNERYKEGIKDILATYSGNVTNGIQRQIMMRLYRKAPMEGYTTIDGTGLSSIAADAGISWAGVTSFKEAYTIEGGDITSTEETTKLAVDHVDENGLIHLNDGSIVDPVKKKRYKAKSDTTGQLVSSAGLAGDWATSYIARDSLSSTSSSEEEKEELPYFPTSVEIEDYFNNFKAVKIGEETYYVPKDANVDIREDMVQPVDITRAIVDNKGRLSQDEKDLITTLVKSWYDELANMAPELAKDIKPVYENGFMVNFREVMNAINEANAHMSDYMYDLLLNDTEEFFKIWSKVTVENADFQDLTTETATQLESMIDTIYANLQLKEKYIETVIATLGNDIKTFNKDLNAQVDEFEYFNEVMNDYLSIIDLTNRRSTNIGSGLISSLRGALLDNAINKVSGTKTVRDTMAQMKALAQETYDVVHKAFEDYRNELLQTMSAEEAVQDAHYQYLQDRLDLVQDEMDIANAKFEDSNKQFLKAWEDALSKIQSDYTDAVQEATRTFEESFSPFFNTLDLLQALFEREKALEDYYVDDYLRIHDLASLDRSIEQSILDTDNLKSKGRLRDLLKEINDLQDEGNDLSAYDLDILQKKYDLELARLALEEAKDAKSLVRLARDNNGNWSYVYTSSEEDVSLAELNYENAIRSMEETNENYIDNLEAQILQVNQSAELAIAALDPSDFANLDEYQAAIENIRRGAEETMRYLAEQLKHAFGNNDYLDPFIRDRYNGLNLHNLTNDWGDMTLAVVSGVNSLDAMVRLSLENLGNLGMAAADAFTEYSDKQAEVYATAGADITDANGYFTAGINTVMAMSDENVAKTTALADRVGDAFEKTAAKVRDFNKDIFDLAAQYEKLNSVMIKFLEISGDYVPEEKLDFSTTIDTYKELDEIKQVLGKYGKLIVTDYDEQGNRRIYNLEENTEATAKLFDAWYDAMAKSEAIDVGDDLDTQEEYDKINAYLEKHGQVYISIDGELKKLSKDNEEDMAWLQDKLTAIQEAAKKAEMVIGDWYGDYEISDGPGRDTAFYGYTNVYTDEKGSHIDVYGGKDANGNFTDYIWGTTNGIANDTGGYTGRWQGAVYADTGMYTGEWDGGSERKNGRLAWLHQKELVLNAHDTENFLDAMNIVRQLDNLASWMANGLGDLFMPKVEGNDETLELNVHIEASFPNAVDHNEIELAFGNLVNLASLYANRKAFA